MSQFAIPESFCRSSILQPPEFPERTMLSANPVVQVTTGRSAGISLAPHSVQVYADGRPQPRPPVHVTCVRATNADGVTAVAADVARALLIALTAGAKRTQPRSRAPAAQTKQAKATRPPTARSGHLQTGVQARPPTRQKPDIQQPISGPQTPNGICADIQANAGSSPEAIRALSILCARLHEIEAERAEIEKLMREEYYTLLGSAASGSASAPTQL